MEASPGRAPRTAPSQYSSTPLIVVLCPHLVEAGMAEEAKKALKGGRDAGLLGTGGEAEVDATVRDCDVCRNPSSLTRLALEPTRAIVVATCHRVRDPSELHRAATKVTCDPSRVEALTVSLERQSGGYPVPSDAPTLWAAIWKAAAHPGTKPENVRAVLSWARGPLSRRSLIKLSYRELVSIPWISSKQCAAPIGCMMCVGACPTGALTNPEPAAAVRLDRAACISCGICVSVCPTGAVELPGRSWGELWASIRGAAEAMRRLPDDSAPLGFLWTCSRREVLPSGWASSRVPCTAALDVRSIIAPLVAGFAMVGIAHCGESCISGMLDTVREKVSFCNDLGAAAGFGSDAVVLFTGDSVSKDLASSRKFPGSSCDYDVVDRGGGLMDRATRTVFSDPPSLREILLAFQPAGGPSSRSDVTAMIAGSASPIGIVTVDNATCTLCGSCAASCPTGALAFAPTPPDDSTSKPDGNSDEVALRFDHATCVACGNCVNACPEVSRGAIALSTAVDFSLLEAGVRTLARSAIHRCPHCGEENISLKSVERVAELLGNSFSDSMLLCNACKGLGQTVSRKRMT